MSNLINEPDASRLISGLRDTGYDFNTAVADIVDNSIAADADCVMIDIDIDPTGEKQVYIGDNGHGMSRETLFEAMRYGAPKRKDLGSLGKFGLGLKTASTSICKRLTVISRNSSVGSLEKLCWDLDHIEKVNRWEMRHDPVATSELKNWEQLCGEIGTLVIWSNCDRMLKDRKLLRSRKNTQSAMKTLRANLIKFLGTTYHRFLDHTDKRCQNISIFVNGEPVEAWNPFDIANSEQMLSRTDQEIDFVNERDETEVIGTARIKAWILPHRLTMSLEERKKAQITYKNQGFYIYREGRLINQGGWLGIFRVHGHLVQLRVEFDFGHELDDVFFVDVKKSQIQVDSDLEEVLTERLISIKAEAERRNKRIEHKKASTKDLDHTLANTSITNTPRVRKPIVRKVNVEEQSAEISNKMGANILVKHPVENNANPKKFHVDAVDTITDGNLWEPVMKSPGEEGHVTCVRINKNHEFYKKVYLNAASNGISVQGLDLLLWAFAVAEVDWKNQDTGPIFEELRDDVSVNLRKLLREFPLPNLDDDNED